MPPFKRARLVIQTRLITHSRRSMKTRNTGTKWLRLQPVSSSSTSAGGSDNENATEETELFCDSVQHEHGELPPNMEEIISDVARRWFSYGYRNAATSSMNTSEQSPLLSASAGQSSQRSYGASGEEGRNETAESAETCPSDENSSEENKMEIRHFLKNTKLAILTGILVFATVSLSFIKVHEESWTNVAVTQYRPASVNITEGAPFWEPFVIVKARGPFLPENLINITQYHVHFTIVKRDANGTIDVLAPTWTVPVAPSRLIQAVGNSEIQHPFRLATEENFEENVYKLAIETNEAEGYINLGISITVQPEIATNQVVMAAIVIIGLYVLIIFDLVHRTLAAMIAATTAIAFLALIGERPSLSSVLSWLDVETLSLLFGMMVLVSILCETGFFDYLAVVAFRVARGRLWALVCCLCVVTTVLSAFLDNVATILLMTPITIRLCEVMNMDPKYMLISLVMFANVGGAGTAVGDPPNIIIISNEDVAKAEIDFGSFTYHMLPGSILCLIGTFVLIRIMFRDVSRLRFADPPEVVEIKHEIEVWKKAYHSLSGYSKDEDTVRDILHRKVCALEALLRKKLYDAKVSSEYFRQNLKELSDTYKIKDVPLLIKSCIVISIVIILFFLQSIPQLELSLGWTAVIGAIILLVLADFDEFDSVFSRVEWSTLLFFAALFVVMEALSQLKLLLYIGQWTQNIITSVGEDQRLVVAILLILWVSALSSCLIDNIPFTTVMIKVVTELSANVKLPLGPLIYALAFGACLGGNGTLIGASANVVAAGVAEQHGYRFTFYEFFKIGFPVMLLTTGFATVYLVICHVVIGWN